MKQDPFGYYIRTETDKKKILMTWLCAVLFLATIVLYLPSLKAPFLYDDNEVILRPGVYENLDNVKKVFTREYFALFGERTYRPVVTLTFFFDKVLWGNVPAGYHAVNTCLHALTAVMVCWLLYMLGVGPVAAFIGAFIFALHPVKTEAVILASNREELLCGLFFFAAYALYVSPRKSARWFSYLSFILATLSKEMAAVLPVVIVAHDLLLNVNNASILQNIKRNFRNYLPYFLIVLIYPLIMFVVLPNKTGAANWPADTAYGTYLMMSQVFLKYLKLLIYPVKLCSDYYTPQPTDLFSVLSLATAAAVPAVIAAALFLKKRIPLISFAIVFFIIALLPVANIYPFGETMAERYLYIPSFALSVMAAWIARNRELKLTPRQAPVAAFAVVLCILTLMRFSVWASDEKYWTATIRCAPSSAEGWMNLGNVYLKNKQPEKALEYYRKVPECKTEYDKYKYYYNLGLAYEGVGKMRWAARAFQMSTDMNPAYPEAHLHLARIFGEAGQYEPGLMHIKYAIASNPHRTLIYYIGAQYIMKYNVSGNDLPAAQSWMEKAVAKEPYSYIYVAALGQIYMRKQEYDKAEKMFKQSIDLDTTNDQLPYMLLRQLKIERENAVKSSRKQGQ